MKKKLLVFGLVAAALSLILAACSGEKTVSSQPVKATWIEPQVSGDTVTVPVSAIEENDIIHFRVAGPDGDIAFMAYDIDDQINVRANVCPPCRSIGFSLSGNKLVCDTCRTTFEATTGNGISGACVAFPKAEVAFENSQGKLVMKSSDLLTANLNTQEAGWP